MRLAYLTTSYSGYVHDFYRRCPELATRPYQEQLAAVKHDAFGWNGAWAPALAPLGYEVQEFQSNIQPVQRAWADERGVPWAADWRTRMPFLQVREYAPDVLFTDDPRTFDARWLRELRGECASLRAVVGFIGGVTYDRETIRSYDAVLSCANWYVDYFRSRGARAALLVHAFNDAVADRLPDRNDPRRSVVFVGNIVRGTGYHLERERLLEDLVAAVPLNLHCPQSELAVWRDVMETNARRGIYLLMQMLKHARVSERRRRSLPVIGRAATWNAMPLPQYNARLAARMQPAAYGLQMYGILRRNAVAFNNHIEVAYGEAGNCRLFEATGIGTALLTDWKSNLPTLFEPDSEVVVYRSAEEAVEKAKWLLDHPAECEQIAAAGAKRTRAAHLFKHRAHDLDAVVRSVLD